MPRRIASALLLSTLLGGLSLPAAEWTILLYMNSVEEKVEEMHLADFVEMADIGSTDEVNLVAMMRRNDQNAIKSYGDWGGTRRGRIETGDRPDTSWGSVIPDASQSRVETLRDYILWGSQTWPAKRYALVFFGHGYGVSGMFADHDPITGSHVPLNYLRIDSALDQTGVALDLVAAHICNGAMWEAAHIYAPYAEVLVAAQRLVDTPDGWAMNRFIDGIIEQPTRSTRDWAEDIVAQVPLEPKSASYQQCISAVDLTSFAAPGGARDQLDAFAFAVLRDGTADDFRALQISNLNDQIDGFITGYDVINAQDAGRFLEAAATSTALTADLRSKAGAALTAYQDAILATASYVESGVEIDTGLAIYGPYNRDTQSAYAFFGGRFVYYQEDMTLFSEASPWDECWDSIAWRHLQDAGSTITFDYDTTPPQQTDQMASNGSWIIGFDEEMARPSFTPSMFALTGPGGAVAVVPSAVTWNADSTSLTLTFPTQSVAGDYELSLTAGLADAWANPLATSPSGTFTVTVVGNRSPVIDTVTADPSPVSDDQTTLAVSTSDPDDDPLTYAWSCTGHPGTAPIIADATADSTTVTFPSAGDYQFQIAVADPTATTISSVTVTVEQTASSIDILP